MEIGRDASIEFLKKFLEITSKCKSRITIVSFDLGHIIILVFFIQLSTTVKPSNPKFNNYF